MNNSKKNKAVISKEHSVKSSITYQSPYRPLFILTFSVFVCELAVMIILSSLPSFPILLEAFFDSILLVFFLSPMLYLFLLRPLVHNINQCKLVERDLIMSESRLRHLLIASPAVIYSSKPSGDYGATFISENVKEQMGFVPHEFIDDPEFWSKNIHPEDAPSVIKELSGLFEKGFHFHEYRFKHKDGNYRWMHDELRLIRDNEGSPIEIVGYWIDITDRRQVEEEREKLIHELQNALAEVKTLSGLLPICSYCNKIRDDEGYWKRMESYIEKRSEAQFSHSICSDCMEKHYPEYDIDDE